MLNIAAKNPTPTIPTSTKSASSCSHPETKKNKPQQHKRVTFSRHVLVHPILSCNNYTNKEFQACWYTNDDRRKIRREANQIVRQMNMVANKDFSSNNISHDSNIEITGGDDKQSELCCPYFDLCTRGLESQTQEGAKIRQRRRQIAFSAVFDIQDEQFNNNIFDEYAIATVYSKLTAQSKLQAYMMGLSDTQTDC